MSKGTKQASIRLSDELREAVEAEAHRRGMTLTALIRAVLQEFMWPGTVKL